MKRDSSGTVIFGTGERPGRRVTTRPDRRPGPRPTLAVDARHEVEDEVPGHVFPERTDVGHPRLRCVVDGVDETVAELDDTVLPAGRAGRDRPTEIGARVSVRRARRERVEGPKKLVTTASYGETSREVK
jgi:hypothetical protein